jgi:hypothetical protein
MLRSKCAIAISCKDGAYYHDWSLDDEYRTADEVVKEDKEEIFAMYKELQDMEGEEKQEVLQELGCGDVPATPEQYIFLLKPLIDAEQMKAGVFKYKSSAPDIEGQNEDPGVGLNTGTCLRCKKPKGAHIAKGGLTSVNFLDNRIGIEMAQAFATLLKKHPTLKSLCGNNGNETELDMRSKEMGTEGATMLRAEMTNNTALSSLHVGLNNIPGLEMKGLYALAARQDSIKTLCEIPFEQQALVELDVQGKGLGFEGALVVAEYLPHNMILSSLNLSDNYLCAKGASVIADAMKVLPF